MARVTTSAYPLPGSSSSDSERSYTEGVSPRAQFMMKKLLGVVLLLGLAYLLYSWDRTPPAIEWSLENGSVVGENATLQVGVSDTGRGLQSWSVVLSQRDSETVTVEKTFEVEQAPASQTAEIDLAALTQQFGLQDGEFRIRVQVSDQPNFRFFDRTTGAERMFTLDSLPPALQVRSGKHYIRQGGAQLILYSTDSETPHTSGVRVGERSFRGFPLEPREQNRFAALIGLDYRHSPETPIRAWAEDLAGNRSELSVPHEILSARFRQRRLNISDQFISKVAAEIFPRISEVSPAPTPAETFVQINHHLRRINHEQIEKLTRNSEDHLLFDAPFVQMANTQVEAAFADERDYIYQGEVIDHQTHLGFDLASLARSPVDCANDGKVVWAGYLGIYGHCVLVDHGLGLASLYGHLSSIDTRAGEAVSKGQSLGRTGETGLAGGDHLHFTTLVQGVPVNPQEWWDPKWVQEQVFDRLNPSEEE